jgi:hypothetical protein
MLSMYATRCPCTFRKLRQTLFNGLGDCIGDGRAGDQDGQYIDLPPRSS